MSETGRYRNYEGADWDLLMVADDIETGVPFAVYRDAEGTRTWIRPLEEFVMLATKIDGPPADESVDALIATTEGGGDAGR